MVALSASSLVWSAIAVMSWVMLPICRLDSCSCSMLSAASRAEETAVPVLDAALLTRSEISLMLSVSSVDPWETASAWFAASPAVATRPSPAAESCVLAADSSRVSSSTTCAVRTRAVASSHVTMYPPGNRFIVLEPYISAPPTASSFVLVYGKARASRTSRRSVSRSTTSAFSPWVAIVRRAISLAAWLRYTISPASSVTSSTVGAASSAASSESTELTSGCRAPAVRAGHHLTMPPSLAGFTGARGRTGLNLLDEVGHRGDDPGRAVREPVGVGAGTDPGEHQDRLQARLQATQHVGVHPVADHRGRLGVRADGVQRRAHHHRVGLADEVRLDPGRLRDHRGHGARGRQDALVGRAGRVRVGADELRPAVDQPDRGGDGLEAVGAGLPQHHVLGVQVGQHVPGVVQRGGQAGLADHVRGAARPLVVQELRGGQGRGPDRGLRYHDADARQPRLQVAGGVDRVVGQDQKRLAGAA